MPKVTLAKKLAAGDQVPPSSTRYVWTGKLLLVVPFEPRTAYNGWES